MGPPSEYTERAPSAVLARKVRCFWTFATPVAGAAATFDVLPDGCADLILDSLGRARWVGTMTRSARVELEPGVRVVGVRFRPGALRAWLGVPLTEFTDETLDALEVEGRGLRSVLERLRAGAEANSTIDGLEAELALDGRRFRQHAEVRELCAELERRPRLPSVAELARASGVSMRTLERRFLVEVGVTPKQHLRFLRFDRARRELERGADSEPDDLRLDRVAARHGYADQAHFTHEFRRFTGQSPGAWRAR